MVTLTKNNHKYLDYILRDKFLSSLKLKINWRPTSSQIDHFGIYRTLVYKKLYINCQ